MTSMVKTTKYSSPSIGRHAAPRGKPVVIGVYGVPGCGKTFLLNELKKMVMAEERFAFYDGSKMIDNMVPGGLQAFRACDGHAKKKWRHSAIKMIKDECVQKECTGVVAGHFMFWDEKERVGETVWTTGDLNTFTHILNLDFDAELVAERRANDTSRERPCASIGHLLKWQKTEKDQLHSLCRKNGILFSAVSSITTTLHRVVALLRDFRLHSEKHNLRLAQRRITELFGDLQLSTGDCSGIGCRQNAGCGGYWISVLGALQDPRDKRRRSAPDRVIWQPTEVFVLCLSPSHTVVRGKRRRRRLRDNLPRAGICSLYASRFRGFAETNSTDRACQCSGRYQRITPCMGIGA